MEGNGDSIDCWRRELMSSPNGHFPCFVEDASGTHDCVGGRSIADRRAAKFGFDASKISTSAFNSSSSSASPAAKSPYLLRTPGICPSALLESPMMLPNLQPSPTTGAFGLRRVGSESGTINATSSIADKDKDIDDSSSFTFNPHCKPVSLPCYSAVQNRDPHRSSAPSSEVEVEFQHRTVTHPPRNAGFEFPTQLQAKVTVDNSEFNSLPDCKVSNDMTVKANSTDCQPSDSHAAAPAAIELQQVEYHRGEDTGKENSDGDRNIQDPSGRGTSEDGYTWRKYGQKQVKGSEFPRSYYECTHPSCPVKKKVEHSHDGQISEIVYKGAHNHPQPQPCRRSTFGEPLRAGDRGGSVQGGGDTVWGDSHHGCDDLKLGSEWRPDGLERKCSTSIAAGISDAPPANQGKLVSALESAGTPKISSTLASNEDDDEDAAAPGSIVAADDHDNEPDLKKQRMEEPLIETALASRAIREPRVIVQIESEVDILDDGYRWRKYGQKIVKGNPNPRSYYKCTHPGCTVRKHVERASHNLKCVLTTYEGKHNHDLPAARNSSHTSSAGGNSAPSSSNPQGLPTQPQNHHLPKSEPQNLAHANRSQDFLRPNFLGNFAGGGASIYQMKFPTLPSTMHYGAFHTTTLMVPAAPGLSTSPSLGFPPPSNLYAPNDSQGRAVGMLQPSFLGQQSKEGDKLIRPMQD